VLAWTPGTDARSRRRRSADDAGSADARSAHRVSRQQQGQGAGRIVLAGKHTIVPVEINPPAKRRPDDQVRTQYDPNNRIRAAPARGG